DRRYLRDRMARAGRRPAAEGQAPHRRPGHHRDGCPLRDPQRRRGLDRTSCETAERRAIVTAIDRAAREIHIAAFLKAAGWASAERGLLAGDASFRRYDRLKMAGRNAVL